MPDSNRVIYPPSPSVVIDPMETLAFLRKAVTNATDELAHYNHLLTLKQLDPRRLFYTTDEIQEKIDHWTQTKINMTRCYNNWLEEMKIK